jgi:putative ATP-binding cassette transporter
MKLLEFFNKESDTEKGKIILMAVISGMASGMLLAIINLAAEQVSNQTMEAQLVLLYITTFALFIYTKKYAFFQTTIAVEEVIHKVRSRIVDKIRSSELRFIEKTESATMYTPLTQDTNLISQATLVFVNASQSMMVLIFSSLYLLWLSPMSLFITLIIFGADIMVYLSHYQKISEELHKASQKEAQFFESFGHILEGFKELKINRRKSEDVFNHVKQISKESSDIKVSSGLMFLADMIDGHINFYLLLAILVFVLPSFSFTDIDVIFKITAAILFIEGSVERVMMAIPMITKTNVAIDNIYQLEAQLDKVNHHRLAPVTTAPIQTFQKIRLVDMSFHYTDKSGKALFSLGPINMTINQGEMLFIVGGNGSGKSTLLKLLIGVYYQASGSLYVDDDAIDQSNYQSYRECFSIIFTDFHLFDKLYGLRDIDEQRLKSLLRLMGLDNKTKYLEGKFTNRDLSTGQKKRLAFIAAVLEDKPIYIFDELAADQDPHFRKYFYEVLLQDLKKQGKTIIAVTHDDKYFQMADRVLKMESGQLVSVQTHF